MPHCALVVDRRFWRRTGGGCLGSSTGRGRGLEPGDVAFIVDDIATSGDALSFAVLGESFLVTSGELGHVR